MLHMHGKCTFCRNCDLYFSVRRNQDWLWNLGEYRTPFLHVQNFFTNSCKDSDKRIRFHFGFFTNLSVFIKPSSLLTIIGTLQYSHLLKLICKLPLRAAIFFLKNLSYLKINRHVWTAKILDVYLDTILNVYSYMIGVEPLNMHAPLQCTCPFTIDVTFKPLWLLDSRNNGKCYFLCFSIGSTQDN